MGLRDGHPIPKGVGIDPTGAPTSDARQILAGAQLPFGGYKGEHCREKKSRGNFYKLLCGVFGLTGANLATMIELLSAALLGTDLAVDHGVDTPYDDHDRGYVLTRSLLILEFRAIFQALI